MKNVLHPPKAHRFDVVVSQDEDGVFSAVARNLPGTGSCGATADEAIANFREAAEAIIASYDDIDAIPWQESNETQWTEGENRQWITIHA